MESWLDALEARHAHGLTFRELRTGVVALSRIYVERRERIGGAAVFGGRAKRAAFACFYTPLHFIAVRHIVEALKLHRPGPKRVLDLGCGLGAAGAAWSLIASEPARVDGVDVNPWAVTEARYSLEALGVSGRMRQARIGSRRIDPRYDALVAAYAVNELSETDRAALLKRLLAWRGTALIVEPIARRPVPWWSRWASAFEARGGRSDTWRFSVDLPPRLERLDRASGLRHNPLSARSLSVRNFS